MSKRNIKIVADSSSDVQTLEHVPFASAALKIITSQKEYVDDSALDVTGMVHELLDNSERVSTACPSVGDWLEAFGEAEDVFCVTITSNLSGSYGSACAARDEYEQSHPGRRVHVIDTLSAGPEMRLVVEKLQELIREGIAFEDIKERIAAYLQATGLVFMLESLKNLANNGRVSRLVASAAGILGIRLVGRASDEGTLEPLGKHRGQKRALPALAEAMGKLGYQGGKVSIAHCLNEEAARNFKALILERFPKAEICIHRCGGLCSFYAEKGGLLVGFEK